MRKCFSWGLEYSLQWVFLPVLSKLDRWTIWQPGITDFPIWKEQSHAWSCFMLHCFVIHLHVEVVNNWYLSENVKIYETINDFCQSMTSKSNWVRCQPSDFPGWTGCARGRDGGVCAYMYVCVCMCGGAGGMLALLPCNNEANFKVVVLCISLKHQYTTVK